MAANDTPNPIQDVLLTVVRDNVLDIFLVAPTLPVTVLFRRNVGFRVLKPWIIYLAFIMLNTVGWLALAGGGLSGSGAAEGLILFAVNLVFVGLSIFWRYSAWGMIKRGELWHTRSRGVSYLSFLPLPESKIQRFVEPGICITAGLILHTVFTFVGLWLIFSGLGLLVLEQIIYDWQLNQMLDQYDGIIDAEVAGQNSQYYENKSSDQAPLTITETFGRSVAVAPELHELIARRRAAAAARQATLENQAVASSVADQVAAADTGTAPVENTTVFDAAITDHSNEQA